MAKAVADTLLGKKHPYAGFFNGVATKLGKFYLGSTGITGQKAKSLKIETVTGFSEMTTAFPIMPNSKKIWTKLSGLRKTRFLKLKKTIR